VVDLLTHQSKNKPSYDGKDSKYHIASPLWYTILFCHQIVECLNTNKHMVKQSHTGVLVAFDSFKLIILIISFQSYTFNHLHKLTIVNTT